MHICTGLQTTPQNVIDRLTDMECADFQKQIAVVVLLKDDPDPKS